jgi:hypothetical protein
MGTYIWRHAAEPREIRCTYTVTMPVVIRKVDRDSWAEFVQALPDSYTMHESDIGTEFIFTEFSYTAASANANDLKRRLQTSQLGHTSGVSSRKRTCGCPEGTTRCQVRTAAA